MASGLAVRRALLLVLLLTTAAPGQRGMRQGLKDAKLGAGKLRAELRQNRAATADTTGQLKRVEARVAVASTRLTRSKRNLTAETTRAGRLALELARAQAKVAERKLAVRRRLRAIYVAGEARPLSAFLTARSPGDLAACAYLLERIASRDRAMYEDLRRWTRYARKRKSEGDASVARLRGLTQEQAERRRELQGAQSAKRDFLARLTNRRQEVVGALAQFEADERRISAAIAAYEARVRAEAIARRARIARRKAELARQRAEYERRLRMARRKRKPAPPRPSETPPEREETPDPDRSPGAVGRPTSGPITSGFGSRLHPILKTRRMHSGVDFGGGFGAPVRAVADGTVVAATTLGGYGQVVILDHGGGVVTVYAHLSSFAVTGGRVRRGQRIGAIGSTGLSTGPHLHFEVHLRGRKVNPMGYL